jgi:heme A synthase
MCAASIYQMMRGIIVVITAGMAMVFLGRKQYFHHYAYLFAIVSAVSMVGLVGIAISNKLAKENPDDADADSTTKPLGIIFLLISQCFTGAQFVVEEKLLSGYYLDPLLVVGLEGFWGCLIYAIILPCFQ